MAEGNGTAGGASVWAWDGDGEPEWDFCAEALGTAFGEASGGAFCAAFCVTFGASAAAALWASSRPGCEANSNSNSSRPAIAGQEATPPPRKKPRPRQNSRRIGNLALNRECGTVHGMRRHDPSNQRRQL